MERVLILNYTVAVDPDPMYRTLTKLHAPPEGLTKVQEENVHVVKGKLKNLVINSVFIINEGESL